MADGKYIGLALAVVSAISIGTSMVVTKMGLIQAAARHGFEGDGFSYLRSPIWWFGTGASVFGEILNAVAYAFAPAILVTPLGGLSVLIGAVLGSYFLKEKLGTTGMLGCLACLCGTVLLVIHAPQDKEVETVDEIIDLALKPLFLLYLATISIFDAWMIFKVSPVDGKTSPLIYLSICSTMGSIAVMAVKAFGIAIRLTASGYNQFKSLSTYIFAIVMVCCLLTQTAYLNKAMNQFPTSVVNALYYVTFTTCTLSASFILFGGLNASDIVNTVMLLAGFLTILGGVYLLTMAAPEPQGYKIAHSNESGGGLDLIRETIMPWSDSRQSRSSTQFSSALSDNGDDAFQMAPLSGRTKDHGRPVEGSNSD